MEKSRFLRACRRRQVDCTPVWFMRQAGRYMQVYRKLREKHTLLELCRTPELAVEVTLQPVRRFDLDAAIIFADILLPLPVIGLDFEFQAGEGPVIHHPVRTTADVSRLHVGEPEAELAFVIQAIRLVRRELPEGVALIGFAGAPFTLASYIIEGGYSRHFLNTKQFMYQEPESWHRLMEILTQVTSRYLAAQVEAGAQAVQLFDSWIGALGREDYRRFVLPYTRRIFEAIEPLGVCTIHFGTGTAGFLEEMKQAGGQVQSVDWRIPLDQAFERLGTEAAVQGNLDPVALLAPPGFLKERVAGILAQAQGRLGHIFNLGHGILPSTPEENVEKVIEWVHQLSRRELPSC